MIADVIQKDRLKEQKLRFIHNHQQAFDVEPIYPLPLFEDFVMSVEGDCTIEASCKVELDKLIASRFLFFFKDQAQDWPSYLSQGLSFFKQVEKRVGVQLDYSLLQAFLGTDFDFSRVKTFTTGIDLRRESLAESSVKIHFRIEDYIEKVETAISLSGGEFGFLDDFPKKFLARYIPQTGFDFYFDGRCEIELYFEVAEDNFDDPNVNRYLWSKMPSVALAPLQDTAVFHLGLSKANTNPVFYYQLKKYKRNLLDYFRLNDAAMRVDSFYRNQDTDYGGWVGVALEELEKTRIENIRLYYYKSFKME
jgi:LynF/TruF/PatF family peptide O-prenyltransferase